MTLGKEYFSLRCVNAKRMTLKEYSGINNPKSQTQDEDGYMVTHKNGSSEWIDKNTFMDNYESIEGMPFGIALELLKKGYSIARMYWSEDVFLSMQVPDEHSKMTHPYIYVTSRFGRVPWCITHVEMLANDWFVREKEEEEEEEGSENND